MPRSSTHSSTHSSTPPNPEDKLVSRKAAAAFIREHADTDTSPGTLAVYDCTKKYDLKPVKKANGHVYYWQSVIEEFVREFLERDLRPE